MSQRLGADRAHVFALHAAQPLVHPRQRFNRDFDRLLAELVAVVEPGGEPHRFFPVTVARDVGTFDFSDFEPKAVRAKVDGGQQHQAPTRALAKVARDKWLQVVDRFADTDEQNRQWPPAARFDDRGEYAALGSAIELGDDQSGQPDRIVERLHLCQRVLPVGTVDDQDDLMRCVRASLCAARA